MLLNQIFIFRKLCLSTSAVIKTIWTFQGIELLFKKGRSQRSSGDSGETLQLSDWSLIIEVPSSIAMCLPCVGQRGEHILHVTSHVVQGFVEWSVKNQMLCFFFFHVLWEKTLGQIFHAHSLLFLTFPHWNFSLHFFSPALCPHFLLLSLFELHPTFLMLFLPC